jgi:hypothetical protein
MKGYLKKLLKAHELWRIKGISVDLVIITVDEGIIPSASHHVNEIVSVSHKRELINTP